jgi:lysophospholipase L1-like esterase
MYTFKISVIITRADNPNLATKVSEINAKLPQVCITNNWGFISHENIDGTHLNTSGVHLNKQGTAIMAQTLEIFLSIQVDFLLQV